MTKGQLVPLGILLTPLVGMIAGEMTIATGEMMAVSISDPAEATLYALLGPL
jgi:uncharacterized protein YqgC (DUF456 family)